MAFRITDRPFTNKRAPVGFAPLAIGLGLTLIHLIGIPVRAEFVELEQGRKFLQFRPIEE